MKTYKKIGTTLGLLGALALGYINPSYAQEVKPTETNKPKVAVLDFEYNNRNSPKIENMLMTGLGNADCIKLYERSGLKKILNEIRVGESGAIDYESAIEVGKLVGVEKVILGDYNVLNDKVRIDVRYIDVKTGEIEKTNNIIGERDDLSLIDRLSEKIRYDLCHKEENKSALGEDNWEPELGKRGEIMEAPGYSELEELAFDIFGFKTPVHEDCKRYLKNGEGPPKSLESVDRPTFKGMMCDERRVYDIERMGWFEITCDSNLGIDFETGKPRRGWRAIRFYADHWVLDCEKGWEIAKGNPSIDWDGKRYPEKENKNGHTVWHEYDYRRRGYVHSSNNNSEQIKNEICFESINAGKVLGAIDTLLEGDLDMDSIWVSKEGERVLTQGEVLNVSEDKLFEKYDKVILPKELFKKYEKKTELDSTEERNVKTVIINGEEWDLDMGGDVMEAPNFDDEELIDDDLPAGCYPGCNHTQEPVTSISYDDEGNKIIIYEEPNPHL